MHAAAWDDRGLSGRHHDGQLADLEGELALQHVERLLVLVMDMSGRPGGAWDVGVLDERVRTAAGAAIDCDDHRLAGGARDGLPTLTAYGPRRTRRITGVAHIAMVIASAVSVPREFP